MSINRYIQCGKSSVKVNTIFDYPKNLLGDVLKELFKILKNVPMFGSSLGPVVSHCWWGSGWAGLAEAGRVSALTGASPTCGLSPIGLVCGHSHQEITPGCFPQKYSDYVNWIMQPAMNHLIVPWYFEN
jgi:hypothetical protein